MEKLLEMLEPHMAKAPEIGLRLLYAIIIFFIGGLIAKIIRSVAKKMMERSKVDPTLVGFSSSLGYILMMTFVIIATINQIGVQTTSIVAVLGAAGLAIGLALQGSLSNFAAGVLLIMFKPIKVGDYIEAAGTAGTVQDISIFTTTLTSPDNKKIIVPNAKLGNDNIVNFSAMGHRRADITVGISYSDNMQQARDLLLNLITSDQRVLQDPKPKVWVSELGDSSVNLVIRPWCSVEDFWPLKFDLTQKVKETLDANGFTIPFPQQDVHLFYENKPVGDA